MRLAFIFRLHIITSKWNVKVELLCSVWILRSPQCLLLQKEFVPFPVSKIPLSYNVQHPPSLRSAVAILSDTAAGLEWQYAFGMNFCELQSCGCHKSNISLQLDDLCSVTKVGITESSCICMQYADFKVLKTRLALWVFGEVSRSASALNLSLISNTAVTTEVFEPYSAVHFVRSLIS